MAIRISSLSTPQSTSNSPTTQQRPLASSTGTDSSARYLAAMQAGAARRNILISTKGMHTPSSSPMIAAHPAHHRRERVILGPCKLNPPAHNATGTVRQEIKEWTESASSWLGRYDVPACEQRKPFGSGSGFGSRFFDNGTLVAVAVAVMSDRQAALEAKAPQEVCERQNVPEERAARKEKAADTWLVDEKHGSKHDPFRIALDKWYHEPRGVLPLGPAGRPVSSGRSSASCRSDWDGRREVYEYEKVDEEGLREWRESEEHQKLRALRREMGSWTGDLRGDGRAWRRDRLLRGFREAWRCEGVGLWLLFLFGFMAFLFTFPVAFIFF